MIARYGRAVGQVDCPFFMCPTHMDDSVVVCDYGNSRIQELYLDDRPPRVLVQYTDDTRPCGIALCDNGDYIITDDCNHRVLRIDSISNSTIKWATGSYGSGPHQFSGPDGVCLLSDGRVVVVDSGNNRLQVLDVDTGALVGTIARSDGEAWISLRGIATDAEGLIYVVEYRKNQVVVITAEGQVVRTLGSYGNGPGQLKYPVGVAVDGKGDVIVADCDNERFVIFHPDGTSALFATPGRCYSVVMTKNKRLVVSGSRFIAEY